MKVDTFCVDLDRFRFSIPFFVSDLSHPCIGGFVTLLQSPAELGRLGLTTTAVQAIDQQAGSHGHLGGPLNFDPGIGGLYPTTRQRSAGSTASIPQSELKGMLPSRVPMVEGYIRLLHLFPTDDCRRQQDRRDNES